jgi:hypothetical protein
MKYQPASSSSRQLLSNALVQELEGMGFRPIHQEGTRELVLARESTRLPGVQIRVYTSSVDGEIREVGQDAIRVCSVLVSGGRERGFRKETRVNRVGEVGAIVERVSSRVGAMGSLIRSASSCSCCGAIMLESRAGNLYCADLCWK